MKIEVMSRQKIEEYSEKQNNETSAIISIASCNQSDADICMSASNNIKAILFLHFDDVDDRSRYDGCITKDDGSKIRKFVEKHLYKVDKIIVNCGAGQSRSAGTAAAILKYYTNNDTQIFDNPRYTPNMLVYRTVLYEFMRNHGKDMEVNND